MNDLISRQKVLRLIRMVMPEETASGALLYQSVSQMESAQPEHRWIPCSERLPVVEYDALGNWCSEEVILLMNEEFTRVCNGHFNPIGVFEVYESNGPAFVGIPVKDVFAWMPLPEPYREE